MITYTNKLNMRPGAVPLVVHLGQYDSDFSLVFNLYSSLGTFSVESGTTAEIRGTKKDGNGYSASATIDISNKRVTVTGNIQMTAIAGENIFELVLSKNGKVLSTANFILYVERAAMDADTVPSESVIREIGEATSEYLDEHPELVYQVDDTLSITGAAADAKKTGDEIADLKSDLEELSGIEHDFDELYNIGKEIYQVLPGGIVENANGTRIRVIFKVKQGTYFQASCDYAAVQGISAFVYATKQEALLAGAGYLQALSVSGYNRKIASKEILYDGYVTVSTLKTDASSAFTAEERQAFLDSLTISLSGKYDDLYEEYYKAYYTQDKTGAEIHQIIPGSTAETSSGTRIKVIYKVNAGDHIETYSTYGQGISAFLYDTLDKAILNGGDFIQRFTLGSYTTDFVEGRPIFDGYLSIGTAKADASSPFSAAEKQAFIDSLYIKIAGQSKELVDTYVHESFEQYTEDGEVYQLLPNNISENSDGTRIRVIFRVHDNDYVKAVCNYSAVQGINMFLYDSKNKAIIGGSDFKQRIGTGNYVSSISYTRLQYDGYLSVSTAKTTATSPFTAEEKRAFLDALDVTISGSTGAEDSRGKTTSELNADMDGALVAMTRYKSFKTGMGGNAEGYKKNFSLSIISDVHGSAHAFWRFIDYTNEHKQYFDSALCLGDVVWNNPATDYGVGWLTDGMAKSEIPFLFVPGNHDISGQGLAAISEADARTKYFSAIDAKGWIPSGQYLGSGKCSWYKDYSDYTMRVIGLYEYGNSATVSSNAPESYSARWMDSALLQWFANTLYSTPTGYSVIVLLHQVPYNQVTYIDDKFTAIHGFRTEPPHMMNSINGNPIEEIVNAFMTSTAISKTYNGNSLASGKSATVSKDFSGRSENGKFVCYLVGHAHTAYVLSSQNFPNQKIVVVNTGTESVYQRNSDDINYDPDTRHKDCFYCVGIDTDRRKINLVQIGGQMTDDMRKRDFTSISY